MKYLKQIDDGSWAVGHIRKDDWHERDGELVFFAERCFDTQEEAEDLLSDMKEPYRRFSVAYVVPKPFAEDLCRKADEARKARDNAAGECGVTVTNHARYHGEDGLECYGSSTEYTGDTDAMTDGCRRFWAQQNYLFGLADAAFELGFVLCWDIKGQRHVIRGRILEPIIREP